VIGHGTLATQAPEPPVRQIEVDLIAQPMLGPDAKRINSPGSIDGGLSSYRKAQRCALMSLRSTNQSIERSM
jgi:hypothetical protein